MKSITVLCPTRGRPAEILDEVNASFLATKTLPDTRIIFVVDFDDTLRAMDKDFEFTEDIIFYIRDGKKTRKGIGDALNEAAAKYVDGADILGFIGDDVRFRTKDWDLDIANALRNSGVAWADDGFNGEKLANHWFVTTDIVKALGWFANPAMAHFYTDNAITDLARDAGCAYYLGHHQMEHLNWAFGKSKKDNTYIESEVAGSGDNVRYFGWKNSEQYQIDLDKVKSCVEATT